MQQLLIAIQILKYINEMKKTKQNLARNTK